MANFFKKLFKSNNPDAGREDIIDNYQWPLFEEQELRTMGWDFLFCKPQWDEVMACLKEGKYEETEKLICQFKDKFGDSILGFDLLLMESQHRRGDFEACMKTYNKTHRPALAFFSQRNKTPLVLELCEAILDQQDITPAMIQLAFKGAKDCLDSVMRDNPPERAYIICIRAIKAAIALGQPLFGGNEGDLIKEYVKSGLARFPESKTLLNLFI